MFTENRKNAETISSHLLLDSPAVAISFVDSVPPGIEPYEGEVPSACTLWRRAESKLFYAAPEKHFNCPIGAMTMGFEMPEAVRQDLMGIVNKMFGCGYITPDEPSKIPSITKKKNAIVYGPLKDFPIEPDLVLMWLKPSQAMMYTEAVGTCRWTEASPTRVSGRPACAALPIAFENSHSALSLGCTGMRTFTEIQEDRLLAVLAGKMLQQFVGGLPSILQANDAMRSFYEGHKAKFVA